jgi:hypothetical protein
LAEHPPGSPGLYRHTGDIRVTQINIILFMHHRLFVAAIFGCLEGWLDDAEPRFNDAEGLGEALVKWLAEHVTVGGRELVNATVESADERLDTER